MTALVTTTPKTSSSRTALYEGVVTHRRFGQGPFHKFRYRVVMPFLRLDEVEAVTKLHPLWSSRRRAPVRFDRRDFFGDPGLPLDDAVRDFVEMKTGRRPLGPISMLAHLRTWGWLFNPIVLYFCFDHTGTSVEALVADVQNTPWHERHPYVVGAPGSWRFPKEMHVSPFLPMQLDYVLTYNAPGDRLNVHFDVLDRETPIFDATLTLRRSNLTHRSMGRVLWSYPAMAHRVSLGIYWQAARLRIKGARFHRHPRRERAGHG